MTSFYLLMQQALLGAMGATTLIAPSTSVHGNTEISQPYNVVLHQSATSTLSFNARMHLLRKRPASLLLAGKELQIILADTNELQVKGLSGSSSIASDRAMLFLFNKPGKYGFWMKDMLYSIDIIWVDVNGKVVHIVRGAAPESFPTIFKPSTDAIAVIEIKSGLAREIGLTEGQYVSFKDASSTNSTK